MDKGTICEFGNASVHDLEVVDVESFLKKLSLLITHTTVGTMFRSNHQEQAIRRITSLKPSTGNKNYMLKIQKMISSSKDNV